MNLDVLYGQDTTEIIIGLSTNDNAPHVLRNVIFQVRRLRRRHCHYRAIGQSATATEQHKPLLK